jgi:hypothetical protein
MSHVQERYAAPDRQPAPYWNPYLAGLLLGTALLASFLVLGAGLGASAAPARFGACVEWCLAPSHTLSSPYFGAWFAGGANPLSYYLVYMFVGFSSAGSSRPSPLAA